MKVNKGKRVSAVAGKLALLKNRDLDLNFYLAQGLSMNANTFYRQIKICSFVVVQCVMVGNTVNKREMCSV